MFNVNAALSKLKLYKEKNDDNILILSFGVYRNTIRLYVKEAKKTDIRKDMLLFSIPLASLNAWAFHTLLKKLELAKEQFTQHYNLYGAKWVDDKRVEGEKEIIGKIGVAKVKNDDGEFINYIYIVDTSDNKYTFPVIPTPFITTIKNGEEVIDKEELSDLWLTSYKDCYHSILSNHLEARVQDKSITRVAINKQYNSSKESDPLVGLTNI